MEFKFDKETATTLGDFEASLESALNQMYEGKSVKHLKFGIGKMSGFKAKSDCWNSVYSPSIMVALAFDSGNTAPRLFSLSSMFDRHANLDFDFGAAPELAAAYECYKEACDHFTAIKKAEIEKARSEAEERARLEEIEARAKKAKASYNKMVKADKAKWKEALDKHESVTDDELISWLADHIGAIYADVPDYLEKWFAGVFPDARYKVFDSKALTANGYKKKWGLALYASIVGCKDPKEYPAEVAQYITNKKLYNTRFLFALCLDHGFKIDSDQDMEAIREAN